ncbi:MAG: hypothetical protein ACT4TC_17615 [Myxococcaceae bacterium]
MKLQAFWLGCLLAAPSAFAGIDATYDVEAKTKWSYRVISEGPRARFEVEGGPAPFPRFVTDNAKKEMSWVSPKTNNCYRLAFGDERKLQVLALERFRKDAQDKFDGPGREEMLKRVQQAIDNANKPKLAETRTLTWVREDNLNDFACERYSVSGGGEMCLQLKGAAPKKFEIITTGEWWRSTQSFMEKDRLPVEVITTASDGSAMKATLRKVERRKIDAQTFVLGTKCLPGLEITKEAPDTP